jgi:hypothetical protein
MAGPALRTEGRIEGGYYVISRGDAVQRKLTLDEARADPRVLAAIERNKWERLDGRQ